MSNGKCLLATLAALALAPQLKAVELNSIADALAQMPNYAACVTYAVTLPQAEDDIIYNVTLQQPASTDSYLINWTVETPSGPQSGFSAWFDGHFYNFRNRRLQESHGQWDPTQPSSPRAPHNTVQFASLLPSRLAEELRAMTPENFIVTIRESPDEVRIDAIRHRAGVPDAELSWRFDASTLQPLEFYADYNPGAISGQQVKAVYSPATNPPLPATEPLSETALRTLHPEAFEKYRESNFAVEQLRGEPLPPFSLPLLNSPERLSRAANDAFSRPVALVIFDPDATLSPRLVEVVRSAVNRLPAAPDIIWACTTKSPDSAAEILGELPPGETALTGAAKLATDCGAANLPVVMACRPDGAVSDLVIGLNNQLDIDVIRMFSTMK